MEIILNNETKLSPTMVRGGKRNVQGATRDVLSFVFPAETSLDELDKVFTVANCENITVVEGENEYIHSGYTVRAELKREPVEISPATAETEAVMENRVTISMAQRTYAESQIASLTDTVDVLVMESLLN